IRPRPPQPRAASFMSLYRKRANSTCSRALLAHSRFRYSPRTSQELVCFILGITSELPTTHPESSDPLHNGEIALSKCTSPRLNCPATPEDEWMPIENRSMVIFRAIWPRVVPLLSTCLVVRMPNKSG